MPVAGALEDAVAPACAGAAEMPADGAKLGAVAVGAKPGAVEVKTGAVGTAYGASAAGGT